MTNINSFYTSSFFYLLGIIDNKQKRKSAKRVITTSLDKERVLL